MVLTRGGGGGVVVGMRKPRTVAEAVDRLLDNRVRSPIASPAAPAPLRRARAFADAIHAMTDAEAQAWLDAHPHDARRVLRAAGKRKRRATKEGERGSVHR